MQPSILNIGDMLDNYRIVRLMSRRETGNLYLANRLGRPVGLQVFPWAFSGDERLISRMWREIAPIYKLNHPGIGTIDRAASANEQVFLITDVVDGDPLDYILGSKPLSCDLVVSYAIQIASAFEAAHGNGLLHLGLNPANIYITNLRLKLLDFGLAGPLRAVFPERSEQLSMAFSGASSPDSGLIYCTHLSPEQAAGAAADARSDLFSFGAVLYEMATGMPAFSSQNSNQSAERLLQKTPKSPRKLNPEIPEALESIILKAIEKERDQRYQSASQMIQDLLEMASVPKLIELQQFATAERLLLRQSALNPGSIELEKALDEVQGRLARILKSNHILQLCRLAEEADSSKRYAEAIEIYTRAVMVDPHAEALRTKNSEWDLKRARTIKDIRAKIERLRELAKVQELPPWTKEVASKSLSPIGDDRHKHAKLNEGEMLQDFRIVRLLEQRPDSDLYEAFDARLERRVAIEHLYSLKGDNAEANLRENLRLLCRLNHPNLCMVYSGGMHGATPYLVLEYLEKATSFEKFFIFGATPRSSLPKRLELIRQVCAGIDFAHRNGAPHFIEVVPANVILMPDRTVKLVDFWPTRLERHQPGTKASAGIFGANINYLAPERINGLPTSERSEVFSIGVLLYQSLTGQPPFSGTDEHLVHQVLNDKPPSAREIDREIPANLDSIVQRAMAKDPADRYQTVSELAEELSRVIDSLRAEPEQLASPPNEQSVVEDRGPTKFISRFSEVNDSAPAAPPTPPARPPEFTRMISGEALRAAAVPPAPPAAPPTPGATRPVAVGPQSAQSPAPRKGFNPAGDFAPPPVEGSFTKFFVAASNAPASSPPPFQSPGPPPPPAASAASEPSVAQSQPELVDRTLDLAFPEKVAVDTAAELLALLRLPSSTSLANLLKLDPDSNLADSVRSRPFGMEFLRDATGNLAPTNAIMRVTAPGFEPSRIEKKVRVRPDRDCERQSFLLTPKQTGQLRVQFDLLIEDVTVASRTLKAEAEPDSGEGISPDKVVVSVPLSVHVRPRRRWLAYAAAASFLLLATGALLYLHPGQKLAATIRGIIVETSKPVSVPITAPGKNYALLFAGDDYQNWPPLNNPIDDAKTIAEELSKNYGFDNPQPQLVGNPQTKQIIDTLHDYGKKTFAANDQLFIYFAGHGFYDPSEKEGYLVGSESGSQKDDPEHSTYIAFSHLSNLLNGIPANHIFVVLDVCYGGAFDQKVTQLTAGRGAPEDEYSDAPDKYIQRKQPLKTRLYLTSGQVTTVPDGKPGKHSPFAHRFIEVLRGYGGKTKLITAWDIADKVKMLDPEPRYGDFGDSEPGADFFFIPR